MIGDPLEVKPAYLQTAKAIFPHLNILPKFTISIAGESGSGKSVTAVALQQVLQEHHLSSVILHQDDYFHLPPATNHAQRITDFNHIGPQEVNLTLLNAHVQAFKQQVIRIEKPLVNYKENTITTEQISFQNVDVLIIEGTYVSLLSDMDTRIFMTRNYLETLENRLQRGRDVIDEFSNQVLNKEHELIREHQHLAHLWVNKDYSVEYIHR